MSHTCEVTFNARQGGSFKGNGISPSRPWRPHQRSDFSRQLGQGTALIDSKAISMNRREMIVAISTAAVLSKTSAAEGRFGAEAEPLLNDSKVYQFADLPRVHLPNGQEDQTVLHGTLATGESLEVHETTLPPGQTPHLAHRHRHSELMLVRSGLLEFDNDGQKTVAGPGSVFFVGSNVLHAVKCVGKIPADYYVIAIGRE
jgi:quercetin dioxygenase-like cupin family protein